jgi:hypothetical protein
VNASKIDGLILSAQTSTLRIAMITVAAIWTTSKRWRRSMISANAPAGRTNKNIGSEVATCTRATIKGSGLSPVISHPAAAFCIQVPMFETTVAIQRTVKAE